MDGSEVPILRSPMTKTTADSKPVKDEAPEADRKEAPTSNKIRVARTTSLAPHSQTWVTVVTKRRGTI
eukprot:IDg6922t1